MTIVERHKAVVQIGFWSSLLSALLAVGWIVTLAVQMSIAPAAQWSGLEQYVRDFRPIEMLNLVPSLLLASTFVVMMVSVHLLAPAEKKVWTLTGLAFTIIYTVMATINYLIQLVVVRFSILSGQTQGLGLLVMGYPYSIFKALANAYAYQSVALFFVAWAFSSGRLENWIRRLFVVVGLTAPFQLAYTLLDLNPLIILPVTLVWAIGVPLGCGLLAALFRRALKTKDLTGFEKPVRSDYKSVLTRIMGLTLACSFLIACGISQPTSTPTPIPPTFALTSLPPTPTPELAAATSVLPTTTAVPPLTDTQVPTDTPEPTATPLSSLSSSNGGIIAFASDRDGDWEIYVMNADGSGQRRLTGNDANDWSPAWSPDGAQIAFVSDRDNNDEIYVMNADGSGQRRLTSNSDYDWSPAWSPDGEWIAFTSNRDGNDEIYVMTADGSDQRRLTSSRNVQDFDPDWSPDGRWIAFTSARDGNDDIHVMDADGGNQRQLTDDGATNWWPAWSPDGTKIAFASKRDGNWEIYVMNSDGSNQRRLTENDTWDWWPAWSPDGTRIAFHSNSGGNWDIYVMDAGGGGRRQLTTDEAADQYPAWRPD